MKTSPLSLEQALLARVRLLATTLRPATVIHYHYTVRLFVGFLRPTFPEVRNAHQLRRDPHMLGWLEYLWLRRVANRAWKQSTRGGHLIRLRKLFDLLSDSPFPPPPGLLLEGDIPRPDQTLPRPLSPEDDTQLIAQLRLRNDLFSHALLLTRWTGMRIGETVHLAPDCLRHLGGQQWAVHVPVGKLHSDRLVPIDDEPREILLRLQYLRTLPPAAPSDFLLPRPKGPEALASALRFALQASAKQAGIAAHIVPHQLRHTYATTMLRAGVSLPALMKLLGHRTANMTLRYVEVTQRDLQLEFARARLQPRFVLPAPACQPLPDPLEANADAVLGNLDSTIRVLDRYRVQFAASKTKSLQLVHRRLIRIRLALQKFMSGTKE